MGENPNGDDPASRPAQPRVAGGLAPQLIYGEACSFLHNSHSVVAGSGACSAGKRNKAVMKKD